MTLETVRSLVPELILICGAAALFVLGSVVRLRWGASWLGFLAIVLAGATLASSRGAQPVLASAYAQASPVTLDSLGMLLREWSILVGGLFVLVISRAAAQVQSVEVVGSLLLVTAGMCVVAISGDLVLLFAGLELISIPSYLLLFLGRRDAQSHEAAMKYFFLSILSSAVLLYGLSFLYGVAGSTSLAEIRQVLSAPQAGAGAPSLLAALAMILVFAGLGFRIAAVPFHFYAPDVYHGTSNPNAGLLAVVPKIAGMAAMIRMLLVAMPSSARLGWQLALVLAILTMTFGNTLALWQKQVRRLLAYSSIAHAGYLLMGTAVAFGVSDQGQAGQPALEGVILYLLTYLLATTGAFAVLAAVDQDDEEVHDVADLAGLGRRYPLAALCLAVCLLSLAGIPPLAGFLGKFGIFAGTVQMALGDQPAQERSLYAVLVVAGAINAAIGLYYYLWIVAVTYFQPPPDKPWTPLATGPFLGALISAALVIGLGCFPSRVSQSIHAAAEGALAASPRENAAGSAFARHD